MLQNKYSYFYANVFALNVGGGNKRLLFIKEEPQTFSPETRSFSDKDDTPKANKNWQTNTYLLFCFFQFRFELTSSFSSPACHKFWPWNKWARRSQIMTTKHYLTQGMTTTYKSLKPKSPTTIQTFKKHLKPKGAHICPKLTKRGFSSEGVLGASVGFKHKSWKIFFQDGGLLTIWVMNGYLTLL